jgi:AcrR family transcriptional regulator
MPAPVTNRTMDREVLRGRIYDTAIAEFRARGYEGATIEAIALRAGVAKGTLFNFYRTKLDVLIEYYWDLDARVAPLREKLDARRPVRALVAYADAVEKLVREEGRLGIDLLDQTVDNAALRDVDHRSGESDEKDYARFFARCRDAGTVRANIDPERAGAMFLDLWSGSVRRWMAADRKGSIAAILKPKLEDLFAGIGPAATKRRA